MGNPTKTQAWQRLLSHSPSIAPVSEKMVAINGIALDLSKTLISGDIWSRLFDLAREQDVEQWRNKMAAGEIINVTEGRAVGHMQLRSGNHADVQHVLDKMKDFVAKTHQSGVFTDVVHIGIGGSDLGPRLVCDALRHLPKKMNVHFVANVDAADIAETLKPLNPDTTLFVIASKTFTTIETMMNAAYARAWLDGRDTAHHMIALSTNAQAVTEFGINIDNMFPFWDWVGGRFSVWSSIGMPIALAYSYDVFADFLDGGCAMDHHFMHASLDQNLPVLMALFGIWNRNFMNRGAVAILPYAQNLSLLPHFLQQLDMESNGKSVDRDGNFIHDYKTGPIVFGQAGTNGQHAFHQWLHQGTDILPCELIIINQSPYHADHQRVLNANAQAQAQAFATGDRNEVNKHKHYEGYRPSIMICLDAMNPYNLGQMIALYEHKIFVQGIIWNINSFDQFGVELGKTIAKSLLS